MTADGHDNHFMHTVKKKPSKTFWFIPWIEICFSNTGWLQM